MAGLIAYGTAGIVSAGRTPKGHLAKAEPGTASPRSARSAALCAVTCAVSDGYSARILNERQVSVTPCRIGEDPPPWQVQIVGEIFDPAGGQPEMIGAISTLSPVDPGLAPDEYLVQVKPGTDIGSYVNALSSALGKGYLVSANDRGGAVLPAIEGLVGTLTRVIALVAGALQCLTRLAGPATGARSGKEFSRPVSIPGLPVRSTSDGGRNGRPPEQFKEMQCGRSSRD